MKILKEKRRLSPDFYLVCTLMLVLVVAPLIIWRVYHLAGSGGLHGGYLWLIAVYVCAVRHCARIGWKGDAARRGGFAGEPQVLTDFTEFSSRT